MKSVLTIGNFDGVHVGHGALLERARRIAGEQSEPTRVVALSFDPHPQSVLAPEDTPARLTTFDRRVDLLRSLGADEVERLDPTGGILDLEPEAFVERLVERFSPVAFVEGTDFHFGRKRAGHVDTLQALGGRFGFLTEVVEPVMVPLDDHTLVRASSSIIRWLIGHGRVREAGRLLGRPHELSGTVERGDRRGRTIGFPTANIVVENLLPSDGVYAGSAELDDGRVFVAAVNIGQRPTFRSGERLVEAHLLDVPMNGSGRVGGAGDVARDEGARGIDGLPEYGWPVRLRLLNWVREQVAFESVQALVGQLSRDCSRVRLMAGLEVPSLRAGADDSREVGACP
jgi:riboflavin kinase/FMN adenylyltransferase